MDKVRTASRYWCHICSQIVNPIIELEIKCPLCQSGFVEEMRATSTNNNQGHNIPDSDFRSDCALRERAPIFLGMMGNSRPNPTTVGWKDVQEDDDAGDNNNTNNRDGLDGKPDSIIMGRKDGIVHHGSTSATKASQIKAPIGTSFQSVDIKKSVLTNPLKCILDVNKLIGPNFSDWLRNLRIVLTCERIAYVLEAEKPKSLAINATEEEKKAFHKWNEDDEIAKCYMLAGMSNELQKQHEKMDARSILLHLQELYGKQSHTVRYGISKALFGARMAVGSSVSDHVLSMISWIEQLAELGFKMDNELSIDLILQSLPPTFMSFIVKFNMNKIKVTLVELLNMLKTYEAQLLLDKSQVMMIDREGSSSSEKSNAKKFSKEKNTLKVKGAITKFKGKMVEKKEKGICFHCGKDGHWKRNCKEYLAMKAKEKHGDVSKGFDK